MVAVVPVLRLGGFALGAVGSALLFLEFFQMPSYVSYDRNFNNYDVDMAPMEVDEYTWVGRVGAFLLALAFSAEFFAVLLS